MKRREFLAGTTAAPMVASAQTLPRPRLYFTRSDAERIRSRSAGLVERARRLLDSRPVPESVAQEGGGQHANYGRPSGQISDMGLTLGLAWHITGEKPFAEKLRETMLAYAAYKRWSGQGLDDRKPAWHSELNTARFCFGFGAGYDAIHDYLSAADRKTIAEAMVRLGIQPTLDDWLLPEKRIHALDSMGHNWWSVCVAMAGVAALALVGDDPRADAWADLVARGLEQWFNYRGNVLQNKPANFDPAGAFYESVGYANYALSEYLRFRLAYGRVFPQRPQPRLPQLAKATEFFLHTIYPTADGYLSLNIGDASLHTSGAPTVRLLGATGFPHPSAAWYLQKTDPDTTDPMALLKPATGERRPNAQSVIYSEIGWAVMRSSWQDDATLLAVKSGIAWNHAHADAGSFLLFHKGVPLLIDSGTCSYSRREYGGYYVQPRAHNVILFNGEGEPREDIRRGSKTPGRVYSLVDGDGVKYCYADATGPMSRYFQRNFRHWLWIDGAILIFDDVLAHEAGRLDWLLHYAGKAQSSPTGAAIANGSAQAEVRFLHPGELAVREEQGLADHRPDEKVSYLAFSPKEAAREQKFVTAVLFEGSPKVDPLAGPLMLGARLASPGGVTEVYLNLQADGRRMHENSNNTIDGYETDAYLLAVTRGAGPPRYFVSCASYLRKNGKVLLDSLTKTDRVWRAG